MSVEFVVDAFLEAVKKEGSIMGPVFFRLFSKQIVEFLARANGEKPPEVDNIDAARESLITITNKKCKTPNEAMVFAANAMSYAVCKAEAFIAGATGPISRRVIRSSVQDTMTLTGLMEEAGKVDAPTGATKFVKIITNDVKYFEPSSISVSKDGKENTLTLSVTNCPGAEVCRTLQTEGVKRVVGEQCQTISMVSLALEFLLNRSVDYKVCRRELSGSGCTMNGDIIIM
jgi:hypothetical protein